LLCAAGIVIVKRPIISLLYGAEYLQGLPVIPILLVFWILNVIVWITGVYPLLIEKTFLPLLSIIPGLTINVALNYTLIPSYGIKGAASATMISYVFILSSVLYHNKREKMKIHTNTIITCMTPVVLLFSNYLLITALVVLVFVTIKSEYFLNKGEKALIVDRMGKFFRRSTIRK
jgi:O-antigen/teichoic acid export membrane protein